MSFFYDAEAAESSLAAQPRAPGPRTGFAENFEAAFEAMTETGTTVSRENALREAWAPIVEQLNEGRDPRRPVFNPYSPDLSAEGRAPQRPPEWKEARLWRHIAELRAADPNAVPAAPASMEALHEQVRARARAALERQAEAVEGATFGGFIGQFAGGVAGAMTDPVNIASLPFGAGSTSLGRTVLIEALVNAGVEGITLPGVAEWRDEIGVPMTPGEMALQVAFAGAGGGALAGIVRGAGPALRAAGNLGGEVAGKIREKLAKVDNATLREMFARVVKKPEGEERAADAGLEAAEAVERSSPFEATADGAEAHRESAEQAAQAVRRGLEGEDGGPPPELPDRPAAAVREEVIEARPPPAPPARAARVGRLLELTEELEQVRAEREVLKAKEREDTASDSERSRAAVLGARQRFLERELTGENTPADRIRETARQERAAILKRQKEIKAERTRLNEEAQDAADRGDMDTFHRLQDERKALQQEFERLDREFLETQTRRLEEAKAADREGQEESAAPRVRPEQLYELDPDEILVDARTFQFKEGGDEAGVTERLQGVTQWDPVKAGIAIVYEDAAGRRFIVDGHQRLGLARRIKAADPSQRVALNAIILREADGVTREMARVRAAGKNLAEGTGTAVDAAKILRAAPEGVGELPPRSALVRQARALVNLSDDAFMMAVNDLVPAHFAAIVGRLVTDPELQANVLSILSRTEPANAVEAESIVRQALAAGSVRETQETLFGDVDVTESLFAERAKVLSRALRRIKSDRAVFSTLEREAGRIEEAGNVLARDVNRTRAEMDAQAAEVLTVLANRKGPISDALTQAARQARETGRFDRPVNEFVQTLRAAIQRGDLEGASVGRAGGRADAPAQDEPGAGGPGLFEPAGRAGGDAPADISRAHLEKFDDPDGTEAAQQADDLLAAARAESDDVLDTEVPTGEVRVAEDGTEAPETRPLREVLDDLDEEEKAVAEMERCPSA